MWSGNTSHQSLHPGSNESMHKLNIHYQRLERKEGVSVDCVLFASQVIALLLLAQHSLLKTPLQNLYITELKL